MRHLLPLALLLFGCKADSDTDPKWFGDDGFDLHVFPEFEPRFTAVLTDEHKLDKPVDLAFHPARSGELWAINFRTENTGGSVVIAFDAGTSAMDTEHRVDGNAWHFMSLPTALAFSPDNENFATTTGVKDANHQGGEFAGPTLWSSDLDIFAKPSGGNGSHLDMLHQSPQSMGIAHDAENAFWVFDGYHGDLVHYDFNDDHGPGNDDHSDGEVHRYPVPIERVEDVPSHMVMSGKWLYVCDTGNSRVLRVDTTTADTDDRLGFNMEILAEHWLMSEPKWEVFAKDGLEQPSGIAADEDYLYVGDRIKNRIIAYKLDDGEEIGRMAVNAEALAGLEIGPDGKLWYVDNATDTIYRVDKK